MALLSSQLTLFPFTVFAPLFEQGRNQVWSALVFADQGSPAFLRQRTTDKFAVLYFPRDLRSGFELEFVAELLSYRHLSL